MFPDSKPLLLLWATAHTQKAEDGEKVMQDAELMHFPSRRPCCASLSVDCSKKVSVCRIRSPDPIPLPALDVDP